MLINERSRSDKELLACGFGKYGYGKFVRTRMAGAVTAGSTFRVGGEAPLYLAVGDVRVDGERLEGKDVEPDFAVPSDWAAPAGASGSDRLKNVAAWRSNAPIPG